MPDPESIHQELTQKGYELAAKFTFREMLEPVREGFKARNAFTNGFRLAVIILFVLTTALSVFHMTSKQLSFWDCLRHFSWGILVTFLLIPLHEWIHGLAFRQFGAKDVRYGVIWRYLMFYAVAHLQVLGARQYFYIGLAPFILITVAGLAALPFCDPAWQLIVMGVLCFHTLCCVGDFGLCAYFSKYIDKQPLTFDDADTGTTYIYLRQHLES